MPTGVCRPLCIVDPGGKLRLTQAHMDQLGAGTRQWADFIREGIIEYLDVNEENSADIAIDERQLLPQSQYTHMEIDPLTILGVCAGLIPCPARVEIVAQLLPPHRHGPSLSTRAMGPRAL